MRSINNAQQSIVDQAGSHVVSKNAFQFTANQLEEGLGNPPSTAQVLDRLVKHRLSDKVDGSPAYYKTSKRTLHTMVRNLGLPSHFITITMNETGDLRGVEYEAIDAYMKQWHPSLSWQQAPVETNRAFIQRFEHVLEHYILNGPKVLGTVLDYAIRYEIQVCTLLLFLLFPFFPVHCMHSTSNLYKALCALQAHRMITNDSKVLFFLFCRHGGI
jgi:hypothetical protein